MCRVEYKRKVFVDCATRIITTLFTLCSCMRAHSCYHVTFIWTEQLSCSHVHATPRLRTWCYCASLKQLPESDTKDSNYVTWPHLQFICPPDTVPVAACADSIVARVEGSPRTQKSALCPSTNAQQPRRMHSNSADIARGRRAKEG